MSDRTETSASPRDPTDHEKSSPQSAMNNAAAAVEQTRAQAAELIGEAKGRAEGLMEDGKAAGAEHATGFARAIHHAADDLEESAPDIARHVRAAGDSIKGLAEAMRERTAGQLLEDVTDFARRQPTLFFGAAAIAGFALVRFASSSAEGRLTGRSHSAGGHGPQRGGSQAGAAPRPATMARTTLGGAVGHQEAEAKAASGFSMPPVRSGSVPNERSDSPL